MFDTGFFISTCIVWAGLTLYLPYLYYMAYASYVQVGGGDNVIPIGTVHKLASVVHYMSMKHLRQIGYSVTCASVGCFTTTCARHKVPNYNTPIMGVFSI